MGYQNGNGNGHSANGKVTKLRHEDIQEMKDVLKGELYDLRTGREENVFLIEALSNQWSGERIIATAQQRGKNWRFLAAIADKALQAQGLAVLVAVGEAAGMDLNEHLMRKSFNVIDRIETYYQDNLRRKGENPYKAEIYEEASRAVVAAFVQGKNAYYQQLGHYLVQMLEG